MATYESNPLVSFRVTLSPTHTPRPHAKKQVKSITGIASFYPRLKQTRDDQHGEAAGRVGGSFSEGPQLPRR